MSEISGSISILFETDKQINEDLFKEFENKLKENMKDFEMIIYDLASECGFEAESPNPISLDSLDYK